MQASLGEQLREALSKWDKEEKEQAAQQAQPASYQKTSPFQISNNLNRTAFREIKDRPDTRKQVTERLVAQGYKIGSVSAVIGHMLRQGVAQLDDEGVIHVTTSEYVPLKSYKTLQNMKKRQEQARKKVTEIRVDVRKRKVQEKVEEKRPVSSSVGIAALSPAPAPTPAPMPTKPWSVYGLLETLSILQARDLYDELKKIFEVNK